MSAARLRVPNRPSSRPIGERGSMRFLHEEQLTRAIRRLTGSRKTKVKLAVAYWGSGSLRLLGLDPSRSNLEIVCCLKGGKSDPNVISRFGSRARQNDKLHAKVIWTRRAAIVSSANASSNGLPEEEQTAAGLIEAGILVDRPPELVAIRKWFDRLYGRAKKITCADLQAAQSARDQRIWNGVGAKRALNRSLLEALRDGGKLEFSKQRIYFTLFKEEQTYKDHATTKRFIRDNAGKLERTLRLPRKAFQQLTWYTGWGNSLPRSAVLIKCFMTNDRILEISVEKTFDVSANWTIKLGSERERVTFALTSGFKGFDYRLPKIDKEIIRQCSHELWQKARGGEDGRIISLIDAAPILLKRSQRR